jgi:tetrachlorobenzoquinone reductase
MNQQTLLARVVRVRAEARDVLSIELADAQGRTLPSYEAGAHIDLHLPSNMIRQYSLCGLEATTDRYQIAVSRAPHSRGGSVHIHDSLRVGATLLMSTPRNNFPLVPNASRYAFIAGGIGITPIMPMIAWCIAHDKPWRLLYCAASRQRAAFVDDISTLSGGLARFYFDQEHGGRHVDIADWMDERADGDHLYCCGPAGLMHSVESYSTNWPPGSLHFEWFAAPPPSSLVEERAFKLTLARTGQELIVPVGRSILEILEEHGIYAPFSCREGLCGSCETALLEGEADHRDSYLSRSDQAANRSIMICVSHARTERLVVDL